MNVALEFLPLVACALMGFQDPASFEEKQLGRIPDGVQVSGLCFERNGRAVAFVVQAGGREAVVVRDGKGAEFDAIELLRFTPGGREVAYVARRGSRRVAVIGDDTGPEFDKIPVLGFSPDGLVSYYLAQEGSKWHAVVDGRKSEGYEYAWPIDFLRGKKAVVYRAVREQGKVLVVVGEERGEEFEEISGPALSPDGNHVAYAAARGGKWRLIVDGRVEKNLDGAVEDVAYGPSGTLAYVELRKEKSVLVSGGRKSEPFDSISQFIFSPDGSRLAFIGYQGEMEYVVVDGRKVGKLPGGGFEVFAFSPDGKRTAFLQPLDFAKSPKDCLVVDGRQGKAFDAISLGPVFSPDGKAVAIGVQEKGTCLVVVGEKRSEGFDRIEAPLIFSPDGKKVAFGARKGLELWWKVMRTE